MVDVSGHDLAKNRARHALVLRVAHVLVMTAVVALSVSGTNILTSHPRLYWGETGTVHEEPWLVLPIPASRQSVPTAYSFRLQDRNGWSRYMHFEAAWVLVLTGATYALWGFASGHFRRNLVPARGERDWRTLVRIIGKYSQYFLRGRPLGDADETRYNLLQRITYLIVIFVVFPGIIATGLAMSPYLAAASPRLVAIMGGKQTARSLHFLLVSVLLAFVVVHVIMVRAVGFWRLVHGMTIGHHAAARQR